MALIKCYECSSNISDKAVACPKCGAELAKGKTRGALRTIVVVGILLVAAFWAMDELFSTNKRERAESEKAFDDLRQATRKAEQLTGK